MLVTDYYCSVSPRQAPVAENQPGTQEQFTGVTAEADRMAAAADAGTALEAVPAHIDSTASDDNYSYGSASCSNMVAARSLLCSSGITDSAGNMGYYCAASTCSGFRRDFATAAGYFHSATSWAYEVFAGRCGAAGRADFGVVAGVLRI